MSTTKTALKIATLSEFIKAYQSNTELSDAVKTLNQRIQENKLANLTDEEKILIEKYNSYKGSRKTENNRILKGFYFTANKANTVIRKEFIKFCDIDDLDTIKTFCSKSQFSNFDEKFNVEQFNQACKSHNLVLKQLLGNKESFEHLTTGFTPQKYQTAILQLSFLLPKTFKNVKNRNLPK